MAAIVPVHHPVPHRFRPRRARIERFGYAAAVTPVELREVGERPREVLRNGNHRVFAAEGKAWTVLKGDAGNVTPAELATFLADPDAGGSPGLAALAAWALRSPLMHYTGAERGRSGRFEPGRDGTSTDDGSERAAADVARFIDGRVRVHGERVLVREERLVGISHVQRSAPWTFLADPARGEGGYAFRDPALVAIRPDRLATLWDLHDRVRKGPVPPGPWDALKGIPSELLENDDVTWLANRLPATMLMAAKNVDASFAQADPSHADPQARYAGRLARMAPALERLVERGWTHSVDHERVGPALDLLRDAIDAGIAMERDYRDRYGVKGDRPALRAYEFLMTLLDEEYLPRLRGGPVSAEEDEAALAGLSPG